MLNRLPKRRHEFGRRVHCAHHWLTFVLGARLKLAAKIFAGPSRPLARRRIDSLASIASESRRVTSRPPAPTPTLADSAAHSVTMAAQYDAPPSLSPVKSADDSSLDSDARQMVSR